MDDDVYDRPEIFYVAHDIAEIFCTSNRDFLVRNNGEQVKVDSLKGKKVGVYMVTKSGRDYSSLDHVIEAYNELIPTNDFEIVFFSTLYENDKVPSTGGVEDSEDLAFNQLFSSMPWLAIPYSDLDARAHLTKLFAPPKESGCPEFLTILDSQGRVLLIGAHDFFELFGADLYPFTPERIAELEEEHKIFFDDKSLKSALGSSSRDFVISNQGKEIPISELEGKVVGIYLYGSRLSLPLLPKLLDIYDKLKEQKDVVFEIVLVNLHFLDNGYRDEESFKECFGRMPWLALPFKDKNCRKLWTKFAFFADMVAHNRGGEDGLFVTFGSDGKLLDEFSAKVVLEYGVEAYPFTRDRAAECEMEKLKVQLTRIFHSPKSKFLIKNNGEKIPICEVLKKNVLMFVGFSRCRKSQKLVSQILKWQEDLNKEKNHGPFEVVYFSLDRDEASFNDLFGKMPWPAFPWDDEVVYQILRDASERGFITAPNIIAFAPNGRIRTLNALLPLQMLGAGAVEEFSDELLLGEVKTLVAVRLIYPLTHEDGSSYSIRYTSGDPMYTSGHIPNF